MWKRVHSKTFTGVKKETVWKILTDINNWHQWHHDLEYCKLEGPFEVGNHFMLKPKTMSAVKIMLTEINHGSSFTDCTTFFGAKMYDTHALEQTPEGLKLTNTLVVTGPLRWLWIKLVAQQVADGIADETENLIALARKHT
jgi:hypothetical protein